MADIPVDPLEQPMPAGSPRRSWPAHEEVHRVRPAPSYLAEGTTPRKVHSGVPDATAGPEAEAFRDNRPLRVKRWLPLVIPLMALMLALAGGSILLLET